MLRACTPTTAARKPKIGEILAELPKVSECHLNNPKIVGSNPVVVALDLAGTRNNKKVHVSKGSHTGFDPNLPGCTRCPNKTAQNSRALSLTHRVSSAPEKCSAA
jgi:hypothetical protein